MIVEGSPIAGNARQHLAHRTDLGEAMFAAGTRGKLQGKVLTASEHPAAGCAPAGSDDPAVGGQGHWPDDTVSQHPLLNTDLRLYSARSHQGCRLVIVRARQECRGKTLAAGDPGRRAAHVCGRNRSACALATCPGARSFAIGSQATAHRSRDRTSPHRVAHRRIPMARAVARAAADRAWRACSGAAPRGCTACFGTARRSS